MEELAQLNGSLSVSEVCLSLHFCELEVPKITILEFDDLVGRSNNQYLYPTATV